MMPSSHGSSNSTTNNNGLNREAKRTFQQQQNQAANSNEGANKKQATPSQKRLQKQQRQQNQSNGQFQGPNLVKESVGGSKPRELDVKVGKLTDKNERCKLTISSRLEEFSKKAKEIKSDIVKALDRQQARVDPEDQSVSESVERLRERMLKLTIVPQDDSVRDDTPEGETSQHVEPKIDNEKELTRSDADVDRPSVQEEEAQLASPERLAVSVISQTSEKQATSKDCLDSKLPVEVDMSLDKQNGKPIEETRGQDGNGHVHASVNPNDCFDPILSARLDSKSKFVALKASLEKHFDGAPKLLGPVCEKLVNMSRQIDQLKQQNESYQKEIGKLRLIKDRLGDLCRELQKSNNQIRIDSLSLIKTEQHKAKEQADKIQTTLADVMKLFNENQQRTLNLKQENIDLQTKLKQSLEHFESWGQCVETALKQRDIENRLIKTELTRLSLIRTEEQERFYKEKQDLLKSVETLRSHQSRVADKEAKLRSDLSSYANKYDQCQELIQNGLGKFQLESKRMLSQIERSRQDYMALLNKYETSNKKIKQLLEEKQAWMKSTSQTNKKLEALEKLSRSLKSENDRLTREAATNHVSETRVESLPSSSSSSSSSGELGKVKTVNDSNAISQGSSSSQPLIPLVAVNDQEPTQP